MSDSFSRRQIIKVAGGFVAGAAAMGTIPLMYKAQAEESQTQFEHTNQNTWAVETPPAETIIDTTPTWNGYSIGPFGEQNPGAFFQGISSFGQTFTVGADNVLTDFNFFLQEDTRTNQNIDIAGYIRAWNSSTESATGPILYRSQPRTVAEATSIVDFPERRFRFGEFTFNSTEGVILSSGNQYVAFISIVGLVKFPYATTSVGHLNDVLPDNYFVFQQYSSIDDLGQQTVPQATSARWLRHPDSLSGRDDAAFRASFISFDSYIVRLRRLRGAPQ